MQGVAEERVGRGAGPELGRSRAARRRSGRVAPAPAPLRPLDVVHAGPATGPVPHNAAEAALNAYGEALADDYDARASVTVSPGPARTPRVRRVAARGVPLEALIDDLATASGIHSGRLVELEDVGAFVAFPASPMAASMTGHDHLVDGGAVEES